MQTQCFVRPYKLYNMSKYQEVPNNLRSPGKPTNTHVNPLHQADRPSPRTITGMKRRYNRTQKVMQQFEH